MTSRYQTTRPWASGIICALISLSSYPVKAQFANSLNLNADPSAKSTPIECANIDLYEEPNSALLQVNIYDQDGTGTCYAMTAAQIADFFNIKNKTLKTKVHPIYAAWVHSFNARRFFKSGTTRGGLVDTTLEDLRKHGVADYDCVEDQLQKLAKKNSATTPEIVSMLETMFENIDSSDLQENAHTAYLSARDRLKTSGKICKSNAANFEIISKQMGQVASTVTTSNEFLGQLFASCPKQKVDIPLYTYDNFGTDREFSDQINLSLARKEPVSLGICATATSTWNKDQKLLGLPWRQPFFNRAGRCGDHAVMLVGSRKISVTDEKGKTKKTCQYLIRNSHGAKWQPGGKPSTGEGCACMTKGENKYKATCKANEARVWVGCWFEADDILQNSLDVGVRK